MSAERHVLDATCLACSCMCDDIALTVVENRVTEVANACAVGRAWFQQPEDDARAICRIGGKEAPLADGVAAAARLLSGAKYPLIYGFGEATCEAQQRAVAIADRVGGTIDTATSFGHAPSIMAFQNVGKVTCSLGEIKNRSDLVIFWGADPAANQPRLLSQYTLDAPGMFLPRGRSDRHCVVIDIQPTATSARANTFLQIKPQSDFEILSALRMLARGRMPDGELLEGATGIAMSQWGELMERMKAARYGAILFGMGLMRTGGRHNNCELLLRLVRDMNDHTRFVCRSVRQRGNVTGADKVVAWRTGYPFCVNLSRGYPRYNAHEYTTALTLARREPDVALIVGNDPMPDFTPASHAQLQAIPYITLSAEETPITQAAAVSFATSRFGIAAAGTVYRMDEVPLALRPAVTSKFPSDEDVLRQIEQALSRARDRESFAGEQELRG
jgi:formylmethanofuran dehydrogenase subunit B